MTLLRQVRKKRNSAVFFRPNDEGLIYPWKMGLFYINVSTKVKVQHYIENMCTNIYHIFRISRILFMFNHMIGEKRFDKLQQYLFSTTKKLNQNTFLVLNEMEGSSNQLRKKRDRSPDRSRESRETRRRQRSRSRSHGRRRSPSRSSSRDEGSSSRKHKKSKKSSKKHRSWSCNLL